jgi:hypothetical protein
MLSFAETMVLFANHPSSKWSERLTNNSIPSLTAQRSTPPALPVPT